MTATIDIAALANLLQEAAVEEILPRFRNLGDGDVRMKTEAIDLVTEADEAAERFIRKGIEAIMPDALFVGEESVAADPALLDRLKGADRIRRLRAPAVRRAATAHLARGDRRR